MSGSESQQTAASVTKNATGRTPPVLPNQPVVILRESELDCDLATAIARVRQDEARRQSRILIVGPDEDASAPEPSSRLPVPRVPSSIGQVARQAGDTAAAAGGHRLEPKLASLLRFFEEIQTLVGEAEEASIDGSRAHIQGQLRAIREVLAWMDATGEDLIADVAGMARGFQQVDLADLAADLRHQIEGFFPGIRVAFAPPEGTVYAWGRAAELAEAMFLATVISAHRIGGQGAIQIEVEEDRAGARVRILGLGEPQSIDLPEATARLRQIVTQEHDGRITPDGLGPFGTGMILEFRVTP